MSSKTYLLDISLSKILNINRCYISDQDLLDPTRCTPMNLGGFTHWSTDPELKKQVSKAISEATKGRIPWNKGKPNPAQSKRWKENNPNKGGKGGKPFKKGNIPHNKRPFYKKSCYVCGEEFETNYNKLACSRSCAATYSNHKRSNTLQNLTPPSR